MEEQQQVPKVTLDDVPFEDRAMIGVCACKEITHAYGRVIYWWLVHLAGSKPMIYPGPLALAELIGIEKHQCYKAIRQLKDLGFVTFGGVENLRTVQVNLVKEHLQTAGINWRRFISISHPEKALPIPGRKKKLPIDLPAMPIMGSPPAEMPEPQPALTVVPVSAPIPVPAPILEPASIPTQTDPPVENKTRAKKPPLTPADVALICASARSMELYLTYGKEKVINPESVQPESILNWRVFVKDPNANPMTAETTGVAEWKIPHFVGLFWYRVALWRERRGYGQGMPKFERLMGDMKNLMQQLGGNWPLLLYVNALTFHFDMFCVMVGKLAENLILDEVALTHVMIQNAVKQYLGVGEAQQTAYRNQYAEAAAAREQQFTRK
jgi:hypothetical protein